MTPYESRLKEIAEKMAKEFDGVLWDTQPSTFKIKAINAMVPLAELCIKECMNAFIIGVGAYVLNTEAVAEGKEEIDYLKELGYIPA